MKTDDRGVQCCGRVAQGINCDGKWLKLAGVGGAAQCSASSKGH